MIDPDPIDEVELVLAEEIRAIVERVTGWIPEDVQVRVRDDTVVYLLEGDDLPLVGLEEMVVGGRALGELLLRALRRRIAPPIERFRLSERGLLIVARLA